MRISRVFNLGLTQATLDFVDVDSRNDVRVFVDPWALRHLDTAWGRQCVNSLQDFFETLLRLIAAGRHDEARAQLLVLREPHEVRLGLSRTRARGRGLGRFLANEIYDRLRRSRAIQSGFLEDLEDTLLFIDGVGPDIISDITINVIREQLIEYTQSIAAKYGIPLTPDTNSGATWGINTHSWHPSRFVGLPISPAGKHLLVPKAIVRRRLEYDVSEYYDHYILSHLQMENLAANTQLVELLKNGKKRVTKVSLNERHPKNKQTILDETVRNPGVLERYRADKKDQNFVPISHEEFAEQTNSPLPDWDSLINDVVSIPTGAADASRYERAVENLLTTLFYPYLIAPDSQTRIHNGRKRIDITFNNVATEGFWGWVGGHYPSAKIFVECKNYSGDVGNPEMDQLACRFSPRRGQVGLLVCRSFDDKLRFIKGCRDTADDGHGFIIPLDDTDLRAMSVNRRENPGPSFALLQERFNRLIL